MPIPPLSPPPSSPSTIKTRLLIISDTHSSVPPAEDLAITPEDGLANPRALAQSPSGFRLPLPEADVVLHCGDLTKRGRPEELTRTFSMLRGLSAPLKLVIAGNHDLALDERLGERTYYDPYSDLQAAHKDALRIAKEAEQDGVRYLTEGTYTFDLANGSTLRLFASPRAPRYGTWAFQYDGMGTHSFDIPEGVDVAMTHGPPWGVLDSTWSNENAGCPDLFRSIYRARPRIHCFGHIHEAWGAQLLRWKHNVDVPDEDGMSKDRGCYLDVTEGENMVRHGEQTLFVNASIMSVRYRPSQMPWVVDIDLPRTTDFTSGEQMIE
ncbi:Metallo-dependent phosphatase [Trichoderma citrinoviride]|uniref:Metallo-dependent phosphatase n=1 Tax=Trichoderma citrinoviride TaxID=58853 RepID=A0A2T4AX35_9HYPO|nr:Metallo-dependent phosphatase [Trichoderma citrinoviride]PTB61635.1 Metallo-dependent phosphatase [Trichoderma citrinoviride]